MSNRNPTDMGGAFAGVPLCSRERCPSYDGKRCGETGNKPDEVCVPEVRAMATRLVEATRTLRTIAKMGVDVTARYFCSMCNADFADEDAVRAHQADCAEHPAVKERDELRRLLDETLAIARAFGGYVAIGNPYANRPEREARLDAIRKEAGL